GALDERVASDEVGKDGLRRGLEHRGDEVVMERLGARACAPRVGERLFVERAERLSERRNRFDRNQGRERRMTVDQSTGLDLEDGVHRLEVAFRRALGDERRAEVGHEHVADKEKIVLSIVDEERIFGLAAGDGDELELEVAVVQELARRYEAI